MATNNEEILKDLNMRDITCLPVDEKKIASTLIDLGKSHFNNSDYLLARLSFEEALRILKKYFDVDKFGLNQKIGRIYELEGNFKFALKFYKEALKLVEIMIKDMEEDKVDGIL